MCVYVWERCRFVLNNIASQKVGWDNKMQDVHGGSSHHNNVTHTLLCLSLPTQFVLPIPPPPSCSHLDQSLFTRFIRLGTPYVELNAQVGEGGGCVCRRRCVLSLLCVWGAGGRGDGDSSAYDNYYAAVRRAGTQH